MISRAAVCPGAPLLIPGLARSLAAQVPELLDACDRAVELLRTADRVLLLSSGPRARDRRARAREVSVVHAAGTELSSSLIIGSFGAAHFTGRLAGPGGAGTPAVGSPAVGPTAAGSPAVDRPAAPPAGVGVIVGAALLARAGITSPVVAVELAADEVADRPAEVARLFEEARGSADRVGLLVMAEGSAGRSAVSPGDGVAEAELLDASLAAALAGGCPAALGAAADVDQLAGTRLLFTAGPALRALAELTTSHPPEHAELLLHHAPFGVGYLVAAWSWAG